MCSEGHVLQGEQCVACEGQDASVTILWGIYAGAGCLFILISYIYMTRPALTKSDERIREALRQRGVQRVFAEMQSMAGGATIVTYHAFAQAFVAFVDWLNEFQLHALFKKIDFDKSGTPVNKN